MYKGPKKNPPPVEKKPNVQQDDAPKKFIIAGPGMSKVKSPKSLVKPIQRIKYGFSTKLLEAEGALLAANGKNKQKLFSLNKAGFSIGSLPTDNDKYGFV